MSEFVTDKDIRAWDALRQSGKAYNKSEAKAKLKERAPKAVTAQQKKKDAKIAKELKQPATALPIRRTAKDYGIVETATAVQIALSILTTHYRYDLSNKTTAQDRMNYRAGWHTFCRLIQHLKPGYNMQEVHNCINVANAPRFEIFESMFLNVLELRPHPDDELRQLIVTFS
jgi:hypothetical protein